MGILLTLGRLCVASVQVNYKPYHLTLTYTPHPSPSPITNTLILYALITYPSLLTPYPSPTPLSLCFDCPSPFTPYPSPSPSLLTPTHHSSCLTNTPILHTLITPHSHSPPSLSPTLLTHTPHPLTPHSSPSPFTSTFCTQNHNC